MEPSLTQFYDTLKSQSDSPNDSIKDKLIKPLSTGPILSTPEGWRHHAVKHREELKDKCAKHLLLDMYVKVLPLDDDYKDGHIGQCQADIDNMLSKKNMSGIEYFQSCYDKTKAPLLEFINRSIEVIGREYFREAEETAKDAKENNIELPAPEAAPEIEDNEMVQSQLVDVKEDPEYDTFVDKLKEKTVNKIVNDITNVIQNSKEDKKMEFDLKNDQSATFESMNYMEKKFLKEGKTITPEQKEEMIGLAVREATLFELDTVFNQRTFREFTSAVRLGRGFVVNEAASIFQ